MSSITDQVEYHSEQLFRCGEIKIASDSFGNPTDPAILLIMGLSTQLIHWPEDFCRQLASHGFWVIRMDNRDIGKSTHLTTYKAPGFGRLLAHRWFKAPVTAPYSLTDMSEDAIGLLNARGIKKAHVVGVSMGGMIAQLMAINHPDRLLSMTNLMTSSGNRRLMHPKLNALIAMSRKPRPGVQGYVEHGLKLWRTLHGPHLPFPDEYIQQILTHATQRGVSKSGVLRQLTAIATAPDRTEALKQLSLPVLIIHGDADPLLKVHNAHALSKAIPHADTLILKGMGHTLPREYWPDIINAIVEKVREAS